MIGPDTALAHLHQLRHPALVIAYAMHAQQMAVLLPALLNAGQGQVAFLPGPTSN